MKNLHLNAELESLLITRQQAKIRQESNDEEMSLNLYYLWLDEWIKLKPSTKIQSGQLLSQRLLLLENQPGVRQKLKQAVLRSSKSVHDLSSDDKNVDEEMIRIRPRHYVFPEAEKEGLNIFCYVDVPLPKGQKERWYVELERDVYNKDLLLLPMLEDGRGPADEEEEVITFPAKAYKNLTVDQEPFNHLENSEVTTETYQCHSCSQSYTNINNLKYHQEIHHGTMEVEK